MSFVPVASIFGAEPWTFELQSCDAYQTSYASRLLVLNSFFNLHTLELHAIFIRLSTPFRKENPRYCHVPPTDADTSVTSLPSLTQQQNLSLPVSAITLVAFLIFIDNFSNLFSVIDCGISRISCQLSHHTSLYFKWLSCPQLSDTRLLPKYASL